MGIKKLERKPSRRFFQEQMRSYGISQRALAKKYNIHHAVLSHFFAGRQKLSIDLLLIFAAEFQISFSDCIFHAGYNIGKNPIHTIAGPLHEIFT
jgi:transcriptional regulator with XRE-family HTH domain